MDGYTHFPVQLTPDFAVTYEQLLAFLEANSVPFVVDDSEGHDVNRICIANDLEPAELEAVRGIMEANGEQWVD